MLRVQCSVLAFDSTPYYIDTVCNAIDDAAGRLLTLRVTLAYPASTGSATSKLALSGSVGCVKLDGERYNMISGRSQTTHPMGSKAA